MSEVDISRLIRRSGKPVEGPIFENVCLKSINTFFAKKLTVADQLLVNWAVTNSHIYLLMPENHGSKFIFRSRAW